MVVNPRPSIEPHPPGLRLDRRWRAVVRLAPQPPSWRRKVRPGRTSYRNRLCAILRGGFNSTEWRRRPPVRFEYQRKLEQDIVGKTFVGHHAFITPPFLAWVYAPFSMLPYIWSYAIWSLFGLACLWLSLHWIDAAIPGRWFGWALVWFPVFASISFGQNSLLSLGILSLTYLLWCRDRRWLAGLVCSLVLYKPQLALALDSSGCWNGGAIGKRCWPSVRGALLAGLSFGLMPESSRSTWNYPARCCLALPVRRDFLSGTPTLSAHSGCS